MRSDRLHAPALAGLVALGALFPACNSSPSGRSQLGVNMVDAPSSAVDQLVVNVTKVTAHSTSGGWVTVGPVTSPLTVDLLKLQTSVASLGLVSLPTGTITQVRLYVSKTGNYVVPTGTTTQAPLVVPSGYESGIKILGPWTVPACTRLTVTLDFDGKNSIEYHSADGTWILRPVIRAKTADGTSISCDTSGGGSTCDATNPCSEGEVCVSGTCAPGTPVAVGGACTTGVECLSGACASGLCVAGNAGAPCQSNEGCVSGACQGDGTCAPGTAVGDGGACASNTDCLSGNCIVEVCQPSGQGAPCSTTADCQVSPAALTCMGGSCQPSAL